MPTESKFSIYESKKYYDIMDNTGFWLCRSSTRDNPPRPIMKIAEKLPFAPKEDGGSWPAEDWRKLDHLLKRDYDLE